MLCVNSTTIVVQTEHFNLKYIWIGFYEVKRYIVVWKSTARISKIYIVIISI